MKSFRKVLGFIFENLNKNRFLTIISPIFYRSGGCWRNFPFLLAPCFGLGGFSSFFGGGGFSWFGRDSPPCQGMVWGNFCGPGQRLIKVSLPKNGKPPACKRWKNIFVAKIIENINSYQKFQ